MKGLRAVAGRQGLAEAALAVVVGIAATTGMWQTAAWQAHPVRPADPLAYVLVTLSAAALITRRRRPVPVLAFTMAVATVALLLHYPYGPPFLAAGVAMYSVAVAVPWQRALIICLAACTALIGGVVVAADAMGPSALLVMAGGAIGWMALPCSVGAVLRVRREDLAQSREEEVRRGAYAERLRLARAIHETAGQELATINIQAAAALRIAEDHPDRALEILRLINQASKTALQDLRATLGALSPATARDVPRSPLPGLSSLPWLVSTMNSSGLEVRVAETGEPADLSAAVDLAAFRIVQQSLANVLRHASATTATVRVEHHDASVLLEIKDNRDADACRRGALDETTGIGEQVAAVGGSLEAGPEPAGGFRVYARLPRR